jgi:flagellar assembly protein FliH
MANVSRGSAAVDNISRHVHSKSVMSKDEADKVAVSYSPQKFPSIVTKAAKEFVAYQSKQSEIGQDPVFRIDRIVSEQTGVAELERASIEERVEREAITRLKDLQEQAYQQAYQLGLDEGRKKAFDDYRSHLDEKLGHLEGVIKTIETLKMDLVNFNEAHIVKLVYFMAKQVLMNEIEERRDLVLNVIRQAIEGAQTDENVTVRISQEDLIFVDQIREKLGKDFDSLKNAKLEASETVSNGGCVIETNYGDVDATVEQRLETLWQAISGKAPKVKKVVGE